MIHIDKGEVPDFWKRFREKNPATVYKQLDDTEEGKKVRHDIREEMLKKQYYLCGYCCKKVDIDDSLNEHIMPRDLYPQKTMDYSNLIVSCKKDSKTCGPKKDKDYDGAKFVSPLDCGCEDHFAFFPDGHIEGTTDEGKYTVELLGLDSYKLTRARAGAYRNIQSLPPEMLNWYLTEHDGMMEPFVDAMKYYVEKKMVDVYDGQYL